MIFYLLLLFTGVVDREDGLLPTRLLDWPGWFVFEVSAVLALGLRLFLIGVPRID